METTGPTLTNGYNACASLNIYMMKPFISVRVSVVCSVCFFFSCKCLGSGSNLSIYQLITVARFCYKWRIIDAHEKKTHSYNKAAGKTNIYLIIFHYVPILSNNKRSRKKKKNAIYLLFELVNSNWTKFVQMMKNYLTLVALCELFTFCLMHDVTRWRTKTSKQKWSLLEFPPFSFVPISPYTKT